MRELRCAGWRENTQQRTLADRAGASLRGSSVVRWVGRSPTVPSGREWNGSQPGQGAAELLSPRPAIRKMQGQPACRAGEPSGQGEEPPPEGLGGGYPLSQTDPRRPAGQVVGHRLDGPERSRESACLPCAFTPLAGSLKTTKTDKKGALRLQTHLLLDRPAIDWPCRPEYDATISFGLLFEPQDSQYGKSRLRSETN